jgi:hypothetical protein
MAKRQTLYPLSQRAALLRIDRKLEPEGKVLRVSRGPLSMELLGRFYVVDTVAKKIVAQDLDLTSYGREIGVLQEWEEVKPE